MNDLLFTFLTWILAVLSIIGVVLNIKKKRICFYIWTVTNASWMTVDFIKGIHAQSFLFLIYTGLAVWGIIEWKKDIKK